MSGLGGAVGGSRALGGALTQREKVPIFRDIYVYVVANVQIQLMYTLAS